MGRILRARRDRDRARHPPPTPPAAREQAVTPWQHDELRGLDAWIEGRHITDDPRSPYYTGPEDDPDTPLERGEGFTACSSGRCGRCDACEAALDQRADEQFERMRQGDV